MQFAGCCEYSLPGGGGIAWAAGESLTTTDTVVSDSPRWVASVRRVTRPLLSVAFLLFKVTSSLLS